MWLFAFGALTLVQVGYWGLLYAGFERARRTDTGAPGSNAALPPCSVVVAARDEEHALPALLNALVRQTHPCYEVIVVDDASTDATAAVVRRYAARHANIRLVRVGQPQPPRKKHALTQGIAAARHEVLAFTDADCTPPPGWLEALARRQDAEGDVLVVGYSPFREAPGVLNALARYETFVTGLYTAAAVGWNRAYMAVGRSMSYPRALFNAVGGFAHSQQSMSGDDDLMVQHVVRCNAAPVSHAFGPETYVPSDAPETWRAWVHQKRRHASAGRYYAPYARLHLTCFHATGLALWAAPLVGPWGLLLLGTKLVVQTAVLRHAAGVLGERPLLRGLPLWELLYTAYPLLLAPLGLLARPRHWQPDG